MFRLTARTPSPIPLELDGVTPAAVANLSALDVAKLQVWHGNRQVDLGQFFDVTTFTGPPGADLHFAGDTRTVKHIGAGMDAGFVYIENDVGMHAGAAMTGGKLVIDGGAGDWLGAEMAGGAIEVRGTAGNLIGAAYRGGRRGMTGGTIVVRGDAGDEVGLLMRRGLIAVGGRVGEFAGASMIAGTLVAAGGAGRGLGAAMKRGTLLVGGPDPDLGPGFAYSCTYRPAFLRLLLNDLHTLQFTAADGFANRDVRCYRGDLVNDGNGELLL